MTLIKKISDKILPKKDSRDLMKLFYDLEGSPEFPFTLALSTFEKLEAQATSQKELIEYLMEDIVFSSLYATFYEEILATIYQNPDVAVPLVNRFSEDQSTREQIIAEQTQSHMNYIMAQGKCPGCAHCDNHQDVKDLIQYWAKQDFKFFVTLYMGMQTIQFTMEYLLYDVVPTCQDYSRWLKRENLLKFRQNLYDFVEQKLNI